MIAFPCPFKLFIYLFIYLSVCLCVGRGGTVWELALSFYLVGPEDQTQVVRLGSKCLYAVSHLASSLDTFIRLIPIGCPPLPSRPPQITGAITQSLKLLKGQV